MFHVVYILFSEKLNRHYIGYSSDFDVRMKFHKKAITGKFTSKADDWELFIKIDCESKSQALAIERHIKSMKSRTYLKNLKKYPEMVEKLKSRFSKRSSD